MKFNAGHVYQITVPKFRQDKRTVSRLVSQRAEGKMTASALAPSSNLPFQAPARGSQWPREPSYDCGLRGQAAFGAVARLWDEDSRVNPRTGERGLNADLVLEGGVKGIGLAGAICILAEAGYRFPRGRTSAWPLLAVLVAAGEKCGKDMTLMRRYLSEVTRKPGAGRA
jgi:hypothetical protein